ncbi:unnamed protein product [Sphacelaria rigidula]
MQARRSSKHTTRPSSSATSDSASLARSSGSNMVDMLYLHVSVNTHRNKGGAAVTTAYENLHTIVADSSEKPTKVAHPTGEKAKPRTSAEHPLTSNVDILRNVLAEFVEHDQYWFFASVCRAWKDSWPQHRPRITRAVTKYTSDSQLQDAFNGGLNPAITICNAAARVGNLKALQYARGLQPTIMARNVAPYGDEDAAAANLSGEGGECGRKQPAYARQLAKSGRRMMGMVMSTATARLLSLSSRPSSRRRQFQKKRVCPWDASTTAEAARGGHTRIVQWLRMHGCPWDWRTPALAARGGYLKVLEWCRANGCPWNEETCSEAAAGDHLYVVQWARANRCAWNAGTSFAAARGGHINTLQWLIANGCPWDARACGGAAWEGHAQVVRWAWENGCVWDSGTCCGAAFAGDLLLLQWARERDCPWDEWTCAGAALGGHLEILKWARENECPWNWTTLGGASEKGHTHVVDWARENGCPEPLDAEEAS